MKKALFLLSFLVVFALQAQFNPNAPWTNKLDKKVQTLEEQKQAFDVYWSTREPNAKGSGFKPFMRWLERNKNSVNENGYLDVSRIPNAWLQTKSQTKTTFTAPQSNWEPIGPTSNAQANSIIARGRVNAFAVDPNNSNIIYMGTPAGGIWKSINNGISWNPMSDFLPQIGVSGIAIDHTNTDILYISTGDRDASDTYSVGVYKSLDGGITWALAGQNNLGNFLGDIIMHPTNPQILWVASNNGIYKTTNGGASWVNNQVGDFAQGSLRLKPNNPNTVYAVSNNMFFISTNGGDSFNSVSTGLPQDSGRLLLDVSPANANYVYVLSANTNFSFQGLYQSINSGTNFVLKSSSPNIFEANQAWYDMALAVSDTDANQIFTGVLNIWTSNNGGSNFTKVNNWYQYNDQFTHADIHYLQYINGVLYCGSDGGLYRSYNDGQLFTDITGNAQISQFYRIATAKNTVAKLAGGTQDNGGYALSNSQWKGYHGGDGMDSGISPLNSNLYYGFTQFGGSLNISSNAGVSTFGNVPSPAGEQGNWITPLRLNIQGDVFSGFSTLYKLQNNNWVEQTLAPNFGQGNIDVIYIDPTNDAIMYVANQNRLYKSTNGGLNFSLLNTVNNNISSIAVNSNMNSTLYLTTSSSFNLSVLKSTDGGLSFTSISNGLPDVGKNAIIHQKQHPNNPLYVATEIGVYYRDDTMTAFEAFNTNLPNVPVSDLEINYIDNKLVASTYGRGIWLTDITILLPQNELALLEIKPILFNCSTSYAPVITIKNGGQTTISTFNYTITSNGINYPGTWNGNLASEETADVQLNPINFPSGENPYTLDLQLVNDTYLDNNSENSSVYINQTGVTNQVNTFTNTSDELYSYSDDTIPLWTRGVRSQGLLNTNGNTVYTTNLNGNYPNNKTSYIVSNCYDLSLMTNPEVRFDMAFDIEEDWDFLVFEYSVNGGNTWEILGDEGVDWYNSSTFPGNNCANCPGKQWTGTDATLKSYAHELSALAMNTQVIFRFKFYSDGYVNNEGVVIDNFVIQEQGSLFESVFNEQNIKLYPNPTKGLFTVELNDLNNKTIDIYDVMGKLIFSQNTTSNKVQIDLSSYATGLYFVKIKTENNTITKRLLKN